MSHRQLIVALITTVASTPLAAQTANSSAPVPELYTLLSTHGDVRILRFDGAPGAHSAMHPHTPHFAYVLRGGLVRFGYPNGKMIDAPLKTGAVFDMVNPFSHSVEVVGTDTVSVLIVEFTAPAKPADSTRKQFR